MTGRPGSYVGRFAPSPTGPLHAGSVAAALASWLDAHAHDGRWLLRIEDLDPPREQPGATDSIIDVLARLGLHHDGPIVHQSRRHDAYEVALRQLVDAGLAYPCACSRREIADSQLLIDPGPRGGRLLVYPGTCRNGLAPGRSPRAWRLRVPDQTVTFNDRWYGPRAQNVAREVGDFVLRRADGMWAYQLAVVIDDAEQGVTDVVRGADLIDSTARQIVLQRALGLPMPRYLHVPVVATSEGEKLSKQTGALPVDADRPELALREALAHLGLDVPEAGSVSAHLADATRAWRRRFGD